jgi:hypothetical protein
VIGAVLATLFVLHGGAMMTLMAAASMYAVAAIAWPVKAT